MLKGSSEVSIKGKWLAKEVDVGLCALDQAGFALKAVVTDNHTCNIG